MRKIYLFTLLIIFVNHTKLFAQLTTLRTNVPAPYTKPVASGGNYYLPLYDSVTGGTELFKTNGTIAGSAILDVNTKSASPFQNVYANGVSYYGTYYFIADDGVSGIELWRSDGTVAGTTMVKDINPGSASAFTTLYARLTVLNGLIYFFAETASHGIELWKSDGTEAGTVMVKDLNTGAGSIVSSNNTPLYYLNGDIYFFDAVNSNTQLWKTDGTDAGTSAVTTFIGYYNISNAVTMGGELYFLVVNRSTNLFDLYKSNGTASGTILIKGGATMADLTATNTHVYFTTMSSGSTVYDELWATAGTSASTIFLADLNGATTNNINIDNITPIGSYLYFTVYNSSVGRTDMWESDGTSINTKIVTLPGGSGTGGSSAADNLISYNGYLIFSAATSTTGEEIFVYNGINNTPSLIKDIVAGTGGSSPRSFTPFNLSGGGTAVLFSTWSSSSPGLWKTQGTGTSTTKITLPAGILYISNLIAMNNGVVFFTGRSSTGINSLYSTDGNIVTQVKTNISTSYPTDVNSVLFFRGDDGAGGIELWKSDGTAAGTTIVKDINVNTLPSMPNDMADLNGYLLFSANNGVEGRELMITDGTTVGVKKDINTGTGSSNPSNLINVGGTHVYFLTESSSGNRRVWRTDGVTTETIKNGPNSMTANPKFTVLKDTLYFIRPGSYKIYKTKDTTTDVIAFSSIYYADNLITANDTMYFVNTASFYNELWKTDGITVAPANSTYSGIIGDLTATTNALFFTDAKSGSSPLVKYDLATGAISKMFTTFTGSIPDTLVNMNGTIFFSYSNGTNGKELWKSDGTVAGTIMIKDIYSGSFSSNPSNFVVVNNVLYFTANDGIKGNELWQTDGTPNGTHIAFDIAPGAASSNPILYYNPSVATSLIHANNTLYAIATTALPVELTQFTATPKNTNVQLNWITTSESNNKGFEIERSTDNTTFENIGFVQGIGNSNQVQSYSFDDNSSPLSKVSVVYYRLKQIDYNNNYQYSKVVSASINVSLNQTNNEKNTVIIYPNPFNDVLTLSIENKTATNTRITIYDAIGKTVYSKNVECNTSQIILDDVKNLKKGFYFIDIDGNILKLIKQ